MDTGPRDSLPPSGGAESPSSSGGGAGPNPIAGAAAAAMLGTDPDVDIAGLVEVKRAERAAELKRLYDADNAPNYVVHGKKLRFSRRSLFCLTESNRFRFGVVWFVNHPWFENFILLLIVANSIILAITNYEAVTPTGELDLADTRNYIVDASEPYFTGVFAAEMVLRIIAMGFVVERGSYLRDPWNILDFVVVVAGLIGLIPGIPNVSAFRVVRVLRPLRSVNAVPGMRLLVQSLLRSIPALAEVMLLLAFAFSIFGILGIQLWSGVLHSRCRITERPVRFANTTMGVIPECRFPIADACEALLTNVTADELVLTRSIAPSRWDERLGMFVASELNTTLLEACTTDPLDSIDWTKETSPWATPKPCFWPIDAVDDRVCSYNEGGEHQCLSGRWCGANFDIEGNSRFVDPVVMISGSYSLAQNWGITQFDNIFSAVLTIFQSITREGWTDIMYDLMDAHNGAVAAIYFVILILFGSFFLLNLLLAVIFDSFSESQRMEDERKAGLGYERAAASRAQAEKARMSGREGERRRSLMISTETATKPSATQTTAGSDPNIVVHSPPSRAAAEPAPRRPSATAEARLVSFPAGSSQRALANSPPREDPVPAPASASAFASTGIRPAGRSTSPNAAQDDESKAAPAAAQPGVNMADLRSTAPGAPGLLLAANASDPAAVLTRDPGADTSPSNVGSVSAKAVMESPAGVGASQRVVPPAPSPGKSSIEPRPVRRPVASKPKVPFIKATKKAAPQLRTLERWHQPYLTFSQRKLELQRMASERLIADMRRRKRCKAMVYDVARSPYLSLVVMLFILANTVVLAADHYPIVPSTAIILDSINFGLTFMFALEMIIKIIGLGMRRYLRDNFNVFDAIIVLITIAELAVVPPTFDAAKANDMEAASSSSGGGVSALRTFRLFRIFALAKNWPSLRVLLQTIIKTLNDVANFAVLLVLFMYIFALIGMQFFANRLCFDPTTGLPATEFQGTSNCPPPFERPRSHFDDILWAFVTIFQVLTGENWNVVMYDCWRATSWVTVFYFVPLVVIGNFVILNLFLAILLGNFEGMEAVIATPPARSTSRLRRVSNLVARAVSLDFNRMLSDFRRAVSRPAQVQPSTDGGAPAVSFASMAGGVVRQPFLQARLRAADQRNAPPAATAAEAYAVTGDATSPPADQLGSPIGQSINAGEQVAQRRPSEGSLEEGGPEDDVWGVDEARRHDADAAASMPAPHDPEAGANGTPIGEPQRAQSRDARPSVAIPSLVVPPPPVPRAAVRATSPRAPGPLPDTKGTDTSLAPPVLPSALMAPAPVPSKRGLNASPEESLPRLLASPTTDAGNRSGAMVPFSPPRMAAARAESPATARDAADDDGAATAREDAFSPRGDLSSGTSSPTVGPSRADSSQRSDISIKQSSSIDTATSFERKLKEKIKPRGKALFVFPASHPWRKHLCVLVQSSAFEQVVIVLILTSSILLAVDNPMNDPKSTLSAALQVIDVIFTALFTLEAVLKILAFGFVLHKDAYLRSGWNMLDFAIVVVSLISLATGDGTGANSSLKSLRSLRTLRALRPLRMISRNPGMRLVVNALISSVRAIINVMFVCLLFFLIFGIMGVNYFKGALYRCEGDGFDNAPDVVRDLITYPPSFAAMSRTSPAWGLLESSGLNSSYAVLTRAPAVAPSSKAVCLMFGFDWGLVIDSHFDHIFAAVGTLFEMSTTEGWMEVMYAGVDSRGIGMQPVRDNNPAWTAFFIVFMIVGSFFILQLFVGVVIDNFNRMKEKLGLEAGQSMFATPEQREWQKTRKFAVMIRPFHRRKMPKLAVRRWALHIAERSEFEWFIMGCILLNTVTMAMTFFGESSEYTQVLEIINFIFAAIFTLEAVLKLLGLGCEYFGEAWNIFDFVIVVGTLVGIVLQAGFNIRVGAIATVIRSFRVGRIFRLAHRAKKLEFYFDTLVQTLPSLANIASLLFLLFFIYAVMGVQLFAEVRQGDALNGQANFASFGGAILTLMRVATGEAWNAIMYDAAAVTEGCLNLADLSYDQKRNMCGYSTAEDCVPLNGCGNPAASFVYFYSFTLFVTFIFLNLFIAIVLESFDKTNEEENMRLKKEDFETLARIWSDFDPDATCLLAAAKLPLLFEKLPPPLGLPHELAQSRITVIQEVRRLAVPIHSSATEPRLRVHFADVSKALAHRVFDEAARQEGKDGFAPPPLSKAELRELHRQFGRGAFRSQTDFDFASYAAAGAIERLFKAYKFRRNIDSRIESNQAAPHRQASKGSRSQLQAASAARGSPAVAAGASRSASASVGESHRHLGSFHREKPHPPAGPEASAAVVTAMLEPASPLS